MRSPARRKSPRCRHRRAAWPERAHQTPRLATLQEPAFYVAKTGAPDTPPRHAAGTAPLRGETGTTHPNSPHCRHRPTSWRKPAHQTPQLATLQAPPRCVAKTGAPDTPTPHTAGTGPLRGENRRTRHPDSPRCVPHRVRWRHLDRGRHQQRPHRRDIPTSYVSGRPSRRSRLADPASAVARSGGSLISSGPSGGAARLSEESRDRCRRAAGHYQPRGGTSGRPRARES
jgi:hypothetical protein